MDSGFQVEAQDHVNQDLLRILPLLGRNSYVSQTGNPANVNLVHL